MLTSLCQWWNLFFPFWLEPVQVCCSAATVVCVNSYVHQSCCVYKAFCRWRHHHTWFLQSVSLFGCTYSSALGEGCDANNPFRTESLDFSSSGFLCWFPRSTGNSIYDEGWRMYLTLESGNVSLTVILFPCFLSRMIPGLFPLGSWHIFSQLLGLTLYVLRNVFFFSIVYYFLNLPEAIISLRIIIWELRKVVFYKFANLIFAWFIPTIFI